MNEVSPLIEEQEQMMQTDEEWWTTGTIVNFEKKWTDQEINDYYIDCYRNTLNKNIKPLVELFLTAMRMLELEMAEKNKNAKENS